MSENIQKIKMASSDYLHKFLSSAVLTLTNDKMLVLNNAVNVYETVYPKGFQFPLRHVFCDLPAFKDLFPVSTEFFGTLFHFWDIIYNQYVVGIFGQNRIPMPDNAEVEMLVIDADKDISDTFLEKVKEFFKHYNAMRRGKICQKT